jgi:hypothetical protein
LRQHCDKKNISDELYEQSAAYLTAVEAECGIDAPLEKLLPCGRIPEKELR